MSSKYVPPEMENACLMCRLSLGSKKHGNLKQKLVHEKGIEMRKKKNYPALT